MFALVTQPSGTDLERAMLADMERTLDGVRQRSGKYRGAERQHLLLLALEREQVVAVAYREDFIVARIEALDVPADVKDLIRQTLVWIWKDEQLHAEYLRGELSSATGWRQSAKAYGRQLVGALSGWTTAAAHHLEARAAPVRVGAASTLVSIGHLLGRVPPVLRAELRFTTVQRYCELNVALEASARRAYDRLIDIAGGESVASLRRIRDDEELHRKAFQVLASAITPTGSMADGETGVTLAERLEALSPWFLPASSRPNRSGSGRNRSFATGAAVAVRQAGEDAEKEATMIACLDAAGLADRALRARTAAVRVSFMMGYDRRDRSNVNDPALVDILARYLRRHGVDDVAILEAPTIYGQVVAHRSVKEVAEYFGFDASSYRLVDVAADAVDHLFDRGLVQHAIPRTWLDADLRIVMPKLRTDPTEFAHLSLSTLHGSTGAIDATFYKGRRIDFRSATMMLLDAAPPDFAVIDGWAPVADGLFGVMGCARPAEVRVLYAGADALSVDEAVLEDLGVDPLRAPIVRKAHHWFGVRSQSVSVDGARPLLGPSLRGAHRAVALHVFGTLGYAVYAYFSDAGERFVPAFDSTAFPTLRPVTLERRLARTAAQRAFGIHPPRSGLR